MLSGGGAGADWVKNLRKTPRVRLRIGSQLQEAALPGRLRVGESIELFAAFARHPVDCTGVGSAKVDSNQRRVAG